MPDAVPTDLLDRRTVGKALAGFAVALVLLGLLAAGIGIDEIAAELADADLRWFAVGCLSTAVGLVSWARAWQVVLRVVGVPVAFRTTLPQEIRGVAVARRTRFLSVEGVRKRLRDLNEAFERIAADRRALVHALAFAYRVALFCAPAVFRRARGRAVDFAVAGVFRRSSEHARRPDPLPRGTRRRGSRARGVAGRSRRILDRERLRDRDRVPTGALLVRARRWGGSRLSPW